jgi:oxalate decarboxylase/phosphoglucose isomerase-like protein (cupin superfamily)
MIRKCRSAALKVIFLSGLWISQAQASDSAPTSGPDSSTYSNDPKIQKLLQDEAQNLTADFPYRINLFKQGQIDKNSAGIRIAETAKQLLSNKTGLLFYYEVVTDAMRVPHWHANATEIGTVLEGKMRVTIWEGSGNTKMYTDNWQNKA